MGTDQTSSTIRSAAQRTGPTGQIERAFAVLHQVVAQDGAIGVRELGRRTGLAKSTVARLVSTLESLGMVERTADGSALAGPGLALFQTGPGLSTPQLKDTIRPLLVQLAETFGEHAALSIDDGDRVLYLDEVASDSAVQVPVGSGQRFPFHVTAPGFVLMTAWSEERLESYIQNELEAPTELSVSAPDEIRARVAYVRRRGYAWTNQELDLEVNGVAAPVRNREGDLVGAVSLYGPVYRLAESLPGSMMISDQLIADIEAHPHS
ncbi:MAG: IclR family transcriptional regulator [Acidimicrobiales bacterium]|jgi:DNA-binding IclR family transcriptional regulator